MSEFSQYEGKSGAEDSILCFASGPSVKTWFLHSVLLLFKNDPKYRFNASYLLTMSPYIHTNRNLLLEQFLETDKQWMFSVDNDMVFMPEDVWELYKVADEKGPGVYSAPYLLEDGTYVCGKWSEEEGGGYHMAVALPEEPMPMDVVGAGFTLIHREVFEALGPEAFSPYGGKLYGEDISFCRRMADQGMTPWIVPESKPGHTKEVVLYTNKVENLVGDKVNMKLLDLDVDSIR